MVRLVACLTLAAWRLSCRRLGGRVVEGFTPLLPRFLGGTAPLYLVVPIRPRQFRSKQIILLRPRSAGSESDDGLPCAERTRTARIFAGHARSVYVSRNDRRFLILISVESVPNGTLSLFALRHE